MEALSTEMQASIHKMSSERLRKYLIKEGRDEDEVMTWDRSRLMEEWATEVGKREEEKFKASPASPAETDYDLQKRRLEFEMYKYEQERKERKEKEEREERRREKEREEREKEREER